MDKQTKEALKQMQAEMRQEIRQLQALVGEQRGERKPDTASSEEPPSPKG